MTCRHRFVNLGQIIVNLTRNVTLAFIVSTWHKMTRIVSLAFFASMWHKIDVMISSICAFKKDQSARKDPRRASNLSNSNCSILINQWQQKIACTSETILIQLFIDLKIILTWSQSWVLSSTNQFNCINCILFGYFQSSPLSNR